MIKQKGKNITVKENKTEEQKEGIQYVAMRRKENERKSKRKKVEHKSRLVSGKVEEGKRSREKREKDQLIDNHLVFCKIM